MLYILKVRKYIHSSPRKSYFIRCNFRLLRLLEYPLLTLIVYSFAIYLSFKWIKKITVVGKLHKSETVVLMEENSKFREHKNNISTYLQQFSIKDQSNSLTANHREVFEPLCYSVTPAIVRLYVYNTTPFRGKRKLK